MLDLADYWRTVGGETLARRFGAALRETLEGVLLFPRAGAPLGMRGRRLRGIRTWRVRGFESYAIYYREVEQRIDLLHALHAARDRERILRARDEPDEPA